MDEALASDLENEEKDQVQRKGSMFCGFNVKLCLDWPIASFLH